MNKKGEKEENKNYITDTTIMIEKNPQIITQVTKMLKDQMSLLGFKQCSCNFAHFVHPSKINYDAILQERIQQKCLRLGVKVPHHVHTHYRTLKYNTSNSLVIASLDGHVQASKQNKNII